MGKLRDISLSDKYTQNSGMLFISGNQALVRLPLIQYELDRRNGLNTGGFISGYRGSPLGGYDAALWQAKKSLEATDVHFHPGLNEELAATAVTGSQQISVMPGATHDGVFGIWYGKGPGVDRALDALKHGNFSGAHENGEQRLKPGVRRDVRAGRHEHGVAVRLDPGVRRRRRLQRARRDGHGGFAFSGSAVVRGRSRFVRVEVHRRAGRRGGYEIARGRGTRAAVRAGGGGGLFRAFFRKK